MGEGMVAPAIEDIGKFVFALSWQVKPLKLYSLA
jgi:hypothetical protein